MKFLWLLFYTALLPAEYAIVFVHLGPNLPHYQQTALAQARLFNPTCPIYLVAESAALENFYTATITCIATETLARSGSHTEFLKMSQRSGFWNYVIERFFYLEEVMRQYALDRVFHLENDVMLYRDLQELSPIFEHNYAGMIAGTFDNDFRCIPGFIYIDHVNPLTKFVEYVASKASLGENDMELLGQFRKSFYKKYIDHLPIIVPSYQNSYSLETYEGKKPKNPSDYANHFEDFLSVFDAAALGQYLGGQDPIHKDHAPGFINESCIFNPAYLSLVWKQDLRGRYMPWLQFQETLCPINNLHIHCKDLQAFASCNTASPRGSLAKTPLPKTLYPLANEPIDVVIYATEKHKVTLDLCIDSMRRFGKNIRRIGVISSEPLSEQAEWWDEKLFPFSCASVLNILFPHDPFERRRYSYHPRNQLQQIYGQLLRLYAPRVVPGLSSNLLLLDPNIVFVSDTDFMTEQGEPKFHVRSAHTPAYQALAVHLLPSVFYGKSVGMSHFGLVQRPILEDLFDQLQQTHGKEPWEAICAALDYSKFYEPCFSALTLYGSFALCKTDQVKLSPLKWISALYIHDLTTHQKEGYNYIQLGVHSRK